MVYFPNFFTTLSYFKPLEKYQNSLIPIVFVHFNISYLKKQINLKKYKFSNFDIEVNPLHNFEAKQLDIIDDVGKTKYN